MLIFVDGLRELEDANKWYEACSMLYNHWQLDKMNEAKLIRTALECWYVLLEGNVIGFSEDDNESITICDMLVECSENGSILLSSNFDTIWAYSYMTAVSTLPFSWNSNGDSEDLKWEVIGRKLKEKGRLLFPDQPLAKLAFAEFIDHDAYQRELSLRNIDINRIFPNNDALSAYFREVYRAHF